MTVTKLFPGRHDISLRPFVQQSEVLQVVPLVDYILIVCIYDVPTGLIFAFSTSMLCTQKFLLSRASLHRVYLKFVYLRSIFIESPISMGQISECSIILFVCISSLIWRENYLTRATYEFC